MRNNNKKGFTLLEVIAAVFIFSIGILAAYRIIPSIISNTTINSSKTVAAYLAQEGIEIVRKIRDGNWLELNNDGITPLDEGLTACSSGCTADYTILDQEDPHLSIPAERATSTLLKIDSTGFYKYICPACTSTKFNRTITITQVGGVLNIIADVSWVEKGKTYHFVAREKLYQWQ
jgi:prepilin-type N-terminal cleavage/methylation domain-containing protein